MWRETFSCWDGEIRVVNLFLSRTLFQECFRAKNYTDVLGHLLMESILLMDYLGALNFCAIMLTIMNILTNAKFSFALSLKTQ